jgi:hypothetical protein
MKGLSLNDIYDLVDGTRFRFRDITTLRDYLALAINRWTMDGKPLWLSAICCEDGMETTKGCSDKKYILLSSGEELSWLRRLKQDRATKRILKAYELSRKSP